MLKSKLSLRMDNFVGYLSVLSLFVLAGSCWLTSYVIDKCNEMKSKLAHCQRASQEQIEIINSAISEVRDSNHITDGYIVISNDLILVTNNTNEFKRIKKLNIVDWEK